MSHKFSFGLSEIFCIFGCWALVLQENVLQSVILISLSFFLAFCRFAMEIQKRTERNKSFNELAKSLKTDFISNKIFSKKFDGTTH